MSARSELIISGLVATSIIIALLLIPAFARNDVYIINTPVSSGDTPQTQDMTLIADCSYSSGTSQTCTYDNSYNFTRIHIHVWFASSGTTSNLLLRFNGDTGANYAYRNSINGGADTTGVSQTSMNLGGTCINQSSGCYITCDMASMSAIPKLINCDITHLGSANAGSAPNRSEFAGKWFNTSTQVSSITISQIGTLQFATGTEVRVFGWN